MRLARVLWLTGLLAWAPAWSADTLTIIYRDKAPYSTDDNGQPRGILIDKSRAIFQLAGIEARYVVMPQKRITTELESNQRPACSPGWYKLPERELIGPFTLAIHHDRPQVVLAAAQSVAAVRAHASIKTLLHDPRLKLAMVDGVSYGAEIDAMVKALEPPPTRVTVTALQLARMIAAHRADYMLIDQDDFEYLERSKDLGSNSVQTLQFDDMPPGLARYFWCSKSVTPALIKRINDAIHKLGYDQR